MIRHKLGLLCLAAVFSTAFASAATATSTLSVSGNSYEFQGDSSNNVLHVEVTEDSLTNKYIAFSGRSSESLTRKASAVLAKCKFGSSSSEILCPVDEADTVDVSVRGESGADTIYVTDVIDPNGPFREGGSTIDSFELYGAKGADDIYVYQVEVPTLVKPGNGADELEIFGRTTDNPITVPHVSIGSSKDSTYDETICYDMLGWPLGAPYPVLPSAEEYGGGVTLLGETDSKDIFTDCFDS